MCHILCFTPYFLNNHGNDYVVKMYLFIHTHFISVSANRCVLSTATVLEKGVFMGFTDG